MDNLITMEGLDQVDESELPSFINDRVEEFAPTNEVQAVAISDAFSDIPQLQYESWVNLDLDARVEALQAMEQKVAEIALRPTMLVEAREYPEMLYGECDGQHIFISQDLLTDNQKEAYQDILTTLFHEGRHAYQMHNLYSGTVVEANSEKVEAWRVNLDVLGYQSGDSLAFPEISRAMYYTQPIEVDARVYANEVMRAISI